jgi:hypothetical protein
MAGLAGLVGLVERLASHSHAGVPHESSTPAQGSVSGTWNRFQPRRSVQRSGNVPTQCRAAARASRARQGGRRQMFAKVFLLGAPRTYVFAIKTHFTM